MISVFLCIVLILAILCSHGFASELDLSKKKLSSRGVWTRRENAPEVYYINMDKSVSRREHIENHLRHVGLRCFRIRGNPWAEIYIPKDVKRLWQTAWCQDETEENIPPKSTVKPTSRWANHSSIITGLCGRGPNKKGKQQNTLKELGT